MAKKTAEHPIGRGGQALLPDYADYWVVTAGTGVITKSPFRLAMVEFWKLSGSASNAVTLTLKDGSATSGTTVLASTGRTVYTPYSYPYLRMENGAIFDFSGSSTGVKILVAGVIDHPDQ